MIRQVLAIGSVLLVAGCASSKPDVRPSPSGGPTPPTAAIPVQTLDCGAPIGTTQRPDPDRAVPLGVVSLQSRRIQIHKEADVPGGHVGKTGLQVRVGQEISIRSVGLPHASFNWGNTGAADFGRVFRIPACEAPASAPKARWLTYPGLIAVDRPGCLRLRITAGGRHADVRIGAGAACR